MEARDDRPGTQGQINPYGPELLVNGGGLERTVRDSLLRRQEEIHVNDVPEDDEVFYVETFDFG
jgi:hypothetical protein